MTVLRDQVVRQLVDLKVEADADGLIPTFNVFVNQIPTAFWNNFAERLIDAAPESRKAEAKEAMIQSAYECGYHTGYGILSSPEFRSVVEPMVTEGAKDILRGAYAVFTAWGWAKSGIIRIREGEEMLVRATDYYEADGPKGDFRAFMITGCSAAFFSLAYSSPYPDGMGTFRCVQTRGIENGDPFGEFSVSKA